jgi:uncharacterized membrane protein YgcG
MHHRIAVTAVAAAALIIGACADQEGGARLSTEPNDATPTLTYVTTRSAAIVNPRTHRLETVSPASMPNGVSASIVGGATIATTNAMQVGSFEPGIARTAGEASWTFTDSLKHVHQIVLLYGATGGPPSAMQHYTDGALVSTTAYAWLRTSTGYLRTRSYMQSIRKGSLVGTYTTLTALPKSPLTPGPVQPVRLDRPSTVSPLQRTLGTVAYALAFAFAPQDATAQFYFYACRQQWLHYGVAAVLLSGAASAIAAAPELTPALVTAFIATLGTAAAMEDLLIDCMIANDSVASGGFGGSGGFGSGGGTGGAGGGYDDCLQGSYAAHCTTPFTL